MAVRCLFVCLLVCFDPGSSFVRPRCAFEILVWMRNVPEAAKI